MCSQRFLLFNVILEVGVAGIFSISYAVKGNVLEKD